MKSEAAKETIEKPQAAFMMTGTPIEPKKDIWYVDSGATSHMTPHNNLLSYYDVFQEPHPCSLGDGTSISAYGMRKYYFKYGNGYGFISEVLWVPSLKKNLFSVDRAMGQGAGIKFVSRQRCVEILKNDRILMRGYKQNHLYSFTLEPYVNEEFDVHNDYDDQFALLTYSEDEWYRRFAHSSSINFKSLQRDQIVSGLKLCGDSRDSCKHCALARVHNAPHPVRNTIKNRSVAILHIDT